MENLESDESSSSDENENQDLAEVRNKTQRTSSRQTSDSSVTGTEFRTLEPAISQPRTSGTPSTVEFLLGSSICEPGLETLRPKTRRPSKIPIAGRLICIKSLRPKMQKISADVKQEDRPKNFAERYSHSYNRN